MTTINDGPGADELAAELRRRINVERQLVAEQLARALARTTGSVRGLAQQHLDVLRERTRPLELILLEVEALRLEMGWIQPHGERPTSTPEDGLTRPVAPSPKH